MEDLFEEAATGLRPWMSEFVKACRNLELELAELEEDNPDYEETLCQLERCEQARNFLRSAIELCTLDLEMPVPLADP